MDTHTSIIKPKQPSGSGWHVIKREVAHLNELNYPYEIWAHKENNIYVISAVEVANDPGQENLGPEYHISISSFGVRCSSADALWTLTQFDMLDSDEDNHVPNGKVRNFWKPVSENLIGHVCPCKETEPAMIENKGDFIWRGLK